MSGAFKNLTGVIKRTFLNGRKCCVKRMILNT